MVGSDSNNEIDPKKIQELITITNGEYSEDQIRAVLKRCPLDPDDAIRGVIQRGRSGGWGRGRSGGRGNISPRHGDVTLHGSGVEELIADRSSLRFGSFDRTCHKTEKELENSDGSRIPNFAGGNNLDSASPGLMQSSIPRICPIHGQCVFPRYQSEPFPAWSGSYYGLQPHGQHVTAAAPGQAGLGTYHPGQADQRRLLGEGYRES